MPVSATQIQQVDALVAARFPQYTYVHPESFIVNATVAAGATPGLYTNSAININGSSYSSFPVPQSWVMVLTDLYITSTSADPTDVQVKIYKNNIKTLAITAPLSANIVTNPSRPGLAAPYLYEPNSSLQLPTTPTATAGTTTTTDTFFVDAKIFDASFA